MGNCKSSPPQYTPTKLFDMTLFLEATAGKPPVEKVQQLLASEALTSGELEWAVSHSRIGVTRMVNWSDAFVFCLACINSRYE